MTSFGDRRGGATPATLETGGRETSGRGAADGVVDGGGVDTVCGAGTGGTVATGPGFAVSGGRVSTIGDDDVCAGAGLGVVGVAVGVNRGAGFFAGVAGGFLADAEEVAAGIV